MPHADFAEERTGGILHRSCPGIHAQAQQICYAMANASPRLRSDDELPTYDISYDALLLCLEEAPRVGRPAPMQPRRRR